jgi:hypothetical protein
MAGGLSIPRDESFTRRVEHLRLIGSILATFKGRTPF